MTTILALREHGVAGAWASLREELSAFARPGPEWHDEDAGVHLAVAESPAESGVSASITEAADCVVVLDGALEGSAASESDGEQVARLYRRDGVDGLRTLHGTFALVLWDRRERVMIVARDPLGQRSLAWFHDGERFVVASQAVALLRHGKVPRRVDRAYIGHALTDSWTQPADTTAFDRVRRVRPGFCVIERNGRTEEREIMRLASADLGNRATAADHVAAFWRALRASVADSVRLAPRTCMALSGGLDSACVAVATIDVVGGVDALLLDAGARDSEGDRRAAQAIARRLPRLRLGAVRCDDDIAFSEPWDDLPMLDEPVLLGSAYVPARLHLAAVAREKGPVTILDGEGGDEIFQLASRAGDLLRARQWRTAAGHQGPRAWLATLRRDLLVPALPAASRRRWCARAWRRHDPFPVWMTPAFRASAAVEAILDRQAAWAGLGRSAETLPAMLTLAPTTGSHDAMRTLLAARGVGSASPLLDRRVVEAAMALPADLRLDGHGDKPFLRRAASGYLPEDVVDRAKDQGFFARFTRLGFASPAAREALEGTRRHSLLREWIDAAALERLVSAICDDEPVPARQVQQLADTLSTTAWLTRVERRYGVSIA